MLDLLALRQSASKQIGERFIIAELLAYSALRIKAI
jgi:hypothetical protein